MSFNNNLQYYTHTNVVDQDKYVYTFLYTQSHPLKKAKNVLKQLILHLEITAATSTTIQKSF